MKYVNPSTRTGMDWDLISMQVIHAIDTYNNHKKYVTTKYCAEYIVEHQNDYSCFKGCTYKTIVTRISYALRKSGWEAFTAKGNRSMVYIDPRVVDTTDYSVWVES